MDRPTFMVLGAAKAGTTSLHYYLSQHPEVFVSDPKEPPFFQVEYEKGIGYYWKTYYRAYSGQRHAGEAGHQNLRLPYVTRRIAESVPDARFYVICRNPVERALSAYWYTFTRGWEHRTFEEALEENLQRMERGPLFEDESEAQLYADGLVAAGSAGQIQHAGYVDSGYYARHIERFASVFGLERIKVLFFEDLVRDPVSTMHEVFAFLDLAPISIPDPSAQNRPVSPLLQRFFRRVAATPVTRRFPQSWRARAKRSLGVLFPSSKPQMTPETRRMLIEHFRPHNVHLSHLTGRNLDHWNEVES